MIWIALVLVALLGLLAVAERSWPERGASPRARFRRRGLLPRLESPAQGLPAGPRSAKADRPMPREGR